MQSIIKELRSLKQEEMTMVNLASKISDQLNRLKVEELALQNLVRIQNENEEKQAESDGVSDGPDGSPDAGKTDEKELMDYREPQNIVPLDLVVNHHNKEHDWGIKEEEEEEEEDEYEDMDDNGVHDDIEQFVKQLS